MSDTQMPHELGRDSKKDMVEVARYSLSRSSPTDENANFILANEYMDFCEFLQKHMRKEDFDWLIDRFYAQQAKSNIEGYEKISFPMNFISPEAKQEFMDEIERVLNTEPPKQITNVNRK